MRKISNSWRKATISGLTAIFALGLVSHGAIMGHSTIGERNAALAQPSILTSSGPSINKSRGQTEVSPFAEPEMIQSVGVDYTSVFGRDDAVRGKLFDFTGNGRADWTTITGGAAGAPLTWRVLGNPADPAPNQAFIRIFNYGIVGDAIEWSDFRGDVKTEMTVRRPGDQNYYIAQFPTGPGPLVLDTVVKWGTSTDVTGGEGDFDGDGKIDYCVVRNTANVLTWYILTSTSNTIRALNFGTVTAGFTTVLLNGADINGDGQDELTFAKYSNSTGFVTWYFGDAVTGAGVYQGTFGNFNTMNDVPPADYTGDGKADLVEVQLDQTNLIWYIFNPVTGVTTATVFGIGDPAFANFDFPLRGDYDGDGRQDIAVWRPGTTTFYVLQSSNGSIVSQFWGNVNDTPLAALGTF